MPERGWYIAKYHDPEHGYEPRYWKEGGYVSPAGAANWYHGRVHSGRQRALLAARCGARRATLAIGVYDLLREHATRQPRDRRGYLCDAFGRPLVTDAEIAAAIRWDARIVAEGLKTLREVKWLVLRRLQNERPGRKRPDGGRTKAGRRPAAVKEHNIKQAALEGTATRRGHAAAFAALCGEGESEADWSARQLTHPDIGFGEADARVYGARHGEAEVAKAIQSARALEDAGELRSARLGGWVRRALDGGYGEAKGVRQYRAKRRRWLKAQLGWLATEEGKHAVERARQELAGVDEERWLVVLRDVGRAIFEGAGVWIGWPAALPGPAGLQASTCVWARRAVRGRLTVSGLFQFEWERRGEVENGVRLVLAGAGV